MHRWVMLVAVVMLVAGCNPTLEPPSPVLMRGVAPAELLPLAEQLTQAFVDTRANLVAEVTSASTGQSLVRLAAAETDLAIVPALLPGTEQFQAIPIARDGITIIIHPDNPLKNLTLLELQQIYTGKLNNWRDLQGATLDIQPVVRERDSGFETVFEQLVLNGGKITPNARVFADGQAVVEFVAANPPAIGFISAVLISPAVKVVPVEEVYPTPESLTTGEYPLTGLVYLLILPQTDSLYHQFAIVGQQKAAQAIVAEHGLGRIN